MRAIRCLVAAVLAAGIVTIVTAQPGGGRFGGGGGDTYSLVLTNAALQEEVKVTDAQKEKFKPLVEKQNALNKKRGELFGKGKDFDKDKFAEVQEEGKKLAEDIKKTLDDNLTAAQKKRLKQIAVQVMSVNVFAEPTEEKSGKGFGFGFGGLSEAQKATMKEVADTLKLSDSQKAKIKDIVSEHNKDVGAIRKDIFGDKGFGKGALDPEKSKEFATKSGKVVAETMSKITELLDETQKKAWKELHGEAFDTSKLRPAPPPKKD